MVSAPERIEPLTFGSVDGLALRRSGGLDRQIATRAHTGGTDLRLPRSRRRGDMGAARPGANYRDWIAVAETGSLSVNRISERALPAFTFGAVATFGTPDAEGNTTPDPTPSACVPHQRRAF